MRRLSTYVGQKTCARSWLGQIVALIVALAAVALVQVPLAADTIAEAITPPPPSELVQFRTLSSRTFDNHDGTYTTSAYSGRIHYRDDQGMLRPISSALVPSQEPGYAYENEANSFRAFFKSQFDSDYLQLALGSDAFLLSLQGAAQSQAQTRARGISYSDVFPGVDLRYELQPDGLKETLLLQNAQVPLSYRFLLSPPPGARIHADQRDDGSWAFYLARQARPVFVLDAPWASEADEPVARRRHAALAVSRQGSDFVLDLTLDGTWLHDPARQFPVRVDPTMTIQPPFQDASFDFACPGCAGVTSDRLSIGTVAGADSNPIWRSALQFSLADIPDGASISSAKVKLYFDGTCLPSGTPCGGTSHQIDALRMTNSWSPGSKTSMLAFDATPLTSFTLPSNAAAQWMNWDITSTVQNWYSGAQSNFGLLLKRATEPSASSGPKPPSRNYAAEPTLGPKLEVTYNGNGGELLEPETLHADGAELRWTPYAGPGTPPFTSYEVHRSTSANFTPSQATRLATITDATTPFYRDTSAKAGATFTYKVLVSGVETNARTVTLPADGQAQKTLRPGADAGLDTYVTERSDSQDCVNRGASERLKVGTDAISIWRSLLRFDLSDIPADAAITTATLSLWRPDTTTSALTVRAHRATNNWQEGSGKTECTGDGATWYELVGGLRWKQDGGDYDAAVTDSLTIPAGSQAGWSQWALTPLVQQWIDGAASMGILLRLDDEARVAGKSVDFYASDFDVAPTLRPKLTIAYSDGSHAVTPTVAVTKPAAGLQVSGSAVTIAADASDDRRVESVQFFVDGNSIGSDTSAPYSVSWNSTTVGNGPHSLTARATDDAGNQTTSAAVSITVGNSSPPTTSITSPTGGSVAGTVTVNANASDDVGVTKVEFYADGLLFGTDTTPPFSASWNTLDPALPGYDGAHTLTTKAYDSHQQVTSSTPVSVTAANAAGTLFLADFSAAGLPVKVSYKPGGPQPTYPVDVTVTNRSATTWSATDIVLRYRWFRLGSTTALFDSGNTSLGSAVLPGGQVTRQVVVAPPDLSAGIARASYVLRFDLYNQATSTWFAARGNKPLEQVTPAEQANADTPPPPPAPPALSAPEQLGLEPMFQYDRAELGLGMENLVNVATGNSVVRWVPMEAPGRGLSSVVQLTYNSLEGRCNANKCPIGSGWSLSISSLTRFGQDGLKRTGNELDLTDADGTLHVFDPGTGGQWLPRAGTHLYVREDGANPPGFLVTTPSRVTYSYDCGGNPTSVRDKNGNQLTFEFESPPPPGSCPSKRIADVRDAGGRTFHIDYYAGNPENKRVRTISDHSGRSLLFCYDPQGGDHPNLIKIVDQPPGDLSSCESPTSNSRTFNFAYETENGSQKNRQLLTVSDPRSHDTTFMYVDGGAQDDKLSERTDRTGTSTEKTTFSFTTEASPGTNTTTVLAPPTGAARRTVYADAHDSGHEQGFVDTITRLKDSGPPEVTETTQLLWTNEAPPTPPQPLRHVWKVVAPGPRTTTFTYNGRGLVTDRSDDMGHHWGRTYLDVPDDGGPTTDLLSRSDPNGNTWTFVYDANEINVEKVVDPGHSANDPYLTFTYYTGAPEFAGALETVTDADQHPPTTFSLYDLNGFATRVTDGAGQTSKFSFDENGLLRSAQDPMHIDPPASDDERWYRSVFDYDAFHRRIASSTPYATGQHKVIYSSVVYDANDNVVASRQPDFKGAGETTTIDYDAMDRPTLVTNPQNEKTAYSYDFAGRLTQVTRPKGLVNPPPPPPPADPSKDYSTEYKYDRLDRVVSKLDYDADGVTTRRTHQCFNLAGDLRWVTAPRANLSSAPSSCESDSGVPDFTSRYGYDNAHRLTSVTEPLSNSTDTRTRTYEYFDNGNLHRVFDELGTLTEFTYTPRNELEKRIETFDASMPMRTLVTFLAYDRVGNVTRQVTPRAWDNAGERDPGANGEYVTDYRYDTLNQLDRIALPDTAGGDARAYVHRRYDANGNLRLSTLPITQDELATLCEVQPKQCTVLTRFDPGWIKTTDDGVNPTVRFDYEAEGWQRLRSVCDPTADRRRCKTTTSTYFPDGLPESVERTSMRDPLGGDATASYTYDPDNNLTEADQSRSGSSAGSTVTAQYDGFDAPSSVSQQQQDEPFAHFTDYTYDKNGNVLSRIDNRTGAQPGRKHEFSYDQSDQLSQDYDWVNATRGDAGDIKTDYEYLSTGWDHLKTVSRLDTAPSSWVPKLVSQREYFDNGDLETLSNKTTRNGNLVEVEHHTLDYTDGAVYVNGNRVQDQFTLESPAGGCSGGCTTNWTYGPRENVLSEERSVGGTTNWDYDPALNVKTETSGGTTTTYSYDGNRLRDKRVNNALVEQYLYDLDGNIDCVVDASWSQPKCPASPTVGSGLPSSSLIADYQWHFLGQLQHYELLSGPGAGNKVTNSYDALSRRLEETATLDGQTKHTCFSYLGLTQAASDERRVGTSEACTATPSLTKSYGFDADLVRTTMSVTGGQDPGDYVYARNVHGDPSLLLKAGVGQNGARIGSYGYTAYGSPIMGLTQELAQETSVPFNAYRFNDRRLDPVSGSEDMGARRYSATIGAGRFLQSDAYEGAGSDLDLSLDPLSVNRYAFAAGNPLSYLETDGHAFIAGAGNGSSQGRRTASAPAPLPGCAPLTASACHEDRPWVYEQEAKREAALRQRPQVQPMSPSLRAKYADPEFQEELEREALEAAANRAVDDLEEQGLLHSSLALKAGERAGDLAIPNLKGFARGESYNPYLAVFEGGSILAFGALGRGSGIVAESALGVASGTGGEAASMSIVRTVGRGERVADLLNEGKALTFQSGNEHALVRLASGERAIVSGGPGGIEFPQGGVSRVIAHTHPPGVGGPPSSEDFAMLAGYNQKSSWLISEGYVTKFWAGG